MTRRSRRVIRDAVLAVVLALILFGLLKLALVFAVP
jgi:hypothetical protein